MRQRSSHATHVLRTVVSGEDDQCRSAPPRLQRESVRVSPERRRRSRTPKAAVDLMTGALHEVSDCASVGKLRRALPSTPKTCSSNDRKIVVVLSPLGRLPASRPLAPGSSPLAAIPRGSAPPPLRRPRRSISDAKLVQDVLGIDPFTSATTHLRRPPRAASCSSAQPQDSLYSTVMEHYSTEFGPM